jgi:preprotein translocase subunit YajC
MPRCQRKKTKENQEAKERIQKGELIKPKKRI